MSQRELSEVLLKVAGMIGLFLVLSSVPNIYPLIHAQFDSSITINRTAFIFVGVVNIFMQLILSLVLIIFGKNISNALFSGDSGCEKIQNVLDINRETFAFWIKLIGVMFIFHSIPEFIRYLIEAIDLIAGIQIGYYNSLLFFTSIMEIAFGFVLFFCSRFIANIAFPKSRI